MLLTTLLNIYFSSKFWNVSLELGAGCCLIGCAFVIALDLFINLQ